MVISQFQTTHKNKTTTTMFKMFATVFLILSISSLTQSAPQAPHSEIRGGKWWSLRTEENCGDTLFIEARDQQELICTIKVCVTAYPDPEPRCRFEYFNKIVD